MSTPAKGGGYAKPDLPSMSAPAKGGGYATPDLPSMSAPEGRSLASDQEAEAIVELRRKLAPELEELQSQGFDYPHTTGDIFFLRVLRGNDGNLDKAATWYRKCLEVRKEHGLDKLHKDISGLTHYRISDLPCSDTICQHIKIICDEATMQTPNGDLIQYEYVGGINWEKFMQDIAMDKYFLWQLYQNEARLAAIDRLSRERGWLVKFVCLTDLGSSSMPPKEMMDTDKRAKTEVFEVTAAELIHKVMFLSVPLFFYTIFKVVKPLLPEKTKGSVFLLGNDFAQDPQVVAETGEVLLQKILAQRIGADDADNLSGKLQLVLAGSAFERGVLVTAGQTVNWTYRVGDRDDLEASNARGRLGGILDMIKDATDLRFEVTAVWDPQEGEDIKKGDELAGHIATVVPTAKVSASEGEIQGSVKAERSGIIVLRWTNFHSWVRAKVVSSFEIGVGDA